jgi:hypothetical protein
MRKILTALVAVASLAAAAMATSSTAEARWYGRGWGWGPGPVIGGLAAGAIVGSALAAPYYYPYGYYGAYPYYGYAPGCAWHNVWNGYRWIRVC